MSSPRFNQVSYEQARAIACYVLDHFHLYQWSFQGMGFIRTYLAPDKVWRLHIWDQTHQKPGVTMIHDHPWDLDSWILAGELRNQRYVESPDGALTHREVLIQPGHEAFVISSERDVSLVQPPLEIYGPGDAYHQDWNEVHESASRGVTVTLVHRTRADRPDEARVYPAVGCEWVDAKPYDIGKEEARPWVRQARWALGL